MPNIYDKHGNLHIINDHIDMIEIVKECIGYEFGQELSEMIDSIDSSDTVEKLESEIVEIENENNSMANTIYNSIKSLEKLVDFIERTDDEEIELAKLIFRLNEILDVLERY